MPHDTHQRPAWMIRAGMFLYDHLARRELLPGSCVVNLRRHAAGVPLKPEFKRGFMYSDGWVDDARLVVLNAIDARERGAQIFTRTTCESISQIGNGWQAQLRCANGQTAEVLARCVVNATGPWASTFLHEAAHRHADKHVRLIKGSHIVVKRLFEHDNAYIFQHPDGRIVFAIPYQQDFTLVGTTDIDYHGDIDKVAIDAEEVAYLCELAGRYFVQPITPADVVWSYSGVRPLVEDDAADASAVTRDYRFELERQGAPLLSVFGGKITTFRKLAEEAVDLIAPLLDNKTPAWTGTACLPGGDLFGPRPCNRSVRDFAQFVEHQQRDYPWLPPALTQRFARAYGSRMRVLLDGVAGMAGLGEEIAPGLFAAEVRYLMQHEWAREATDVLWRRSKLGLHLPAGTAETLAAWMQANAGTDILARRMQDPCA
jgi:glycerol-3-phosphate dehydrogenase